MINEEQKIKAQELYDKIGNIKKVAKISHISYSRLRKFIKFKHPIKKKADTKDYRKNIKKRMVEYKGGRCQICGYNKCIEALDFHHLDPKDKDFNISGGTRSFEKLKPEIDKCILVCSNCHREIHAGLIDITTLLEIMAE